MPNLPTKIIPTKTRWLKDSGEFPMDMRVPPLRLKVLHESNPLKSRILAQSQMAMTAEPETNKQHNKENTNQLKQMRNTQTIKHNGSQDQQSLENLSAERRLLIPPGAMPVSDIETASLS